MAKATLAFRGVAHHLEGDFINVCWYIGPPRAGLFAPADFDLSEGWVCTMLSGSMGGIFGVPEVLPKEYYVGKICAQWGKKCGETSQESKVQYYTNQENCPYRDNEGICEPPRFQFNAMVDIETIQD